MRKPYEIQCKCQNTLLVSHSVVWRAITCSFCGRTWWYERNLKGDVRTTKLIGRFRSKKEIERRVYALAQSSAKDLFNKPESTPAQESPSVQDQEDTGNDPVDGSKDTGGSVRSSDQGLPVATRNTRRSSQEVGKRRLAK